MKSSGSFYFVQTPAKSKSTRQFIWKTHMIGRVDFDLAGGGDMSMLEIEKLRIFYKELRWRMVKMVENAYEIAV